MSAALLLEMSPEALKTLSVVVIMVSAFAAAVLYPIARAYARRIEGRAPGTDWQREVADLGARLERLETEGDRLQELENRLDFAERLLVRQPDPARIGRGPEEAP